VFFKRIITTVLVVIAAAVAAPAALAMPDRAPVARPAAPVVQDLRSPDARDAVIVPAGQADAVHGVDFPWLEAGLGAALALALIGLGIATLRRRSLAANA
jgi:hypothetical protein